MSKTKMTVKIWDRLQTAFNSDVDRLCLKRDAFLNRMLSCETECLASDLAGKRLSPLARKYIAGELKRMGTTPVNIVVDQAVADALNAVVEEANIVRDAFFNRMLWLLRGGQALLDYLELPHFITSSEYERYIPEAMPTAPIKAMQAIQSDPLHYLRVACEERHAIGLYLLDLPPAYNGFACWIDDTQVPGTQTYLDADALLAELEAMDTTAFSQFKKGPATTDRQS